MNKKDFIKTLTNTKIIIGNGFDLHCGLHTSYYDYFRANIDKFLYIKNWFDCFKKFGVFSANGYHKNIDKLNVWDAFFILNYLEDANTSSKNWVDVETMILSSLLSHNDLKEKESKIHIMLNSTIHWPEVKYYFDEIKISENPDIDFLTNFLLHKAGEYESGIDFYDLLLKQLNIFEHNFGSFIYRQLHNIYLEKLNGEAFLNIKYLDKSIKTINELTDFERVVSIDSFNYSYFEDERLKELLHQINGDYKSPIFGVDSTYFLPNDKRFIFTKTSRRIETDILSDQKDKVESFDNVVIYGHSLGEADYSYFFPIFDKINLLDSQSNGVVVFAFTLFDENNKEGIRSDLRQSISKILTDYAKSKGHYQPERFLDSLTTHQRILTLEIPLIEEGYLNFADDNWKKIVEDFDKKSKSLEK